MPNRLSLNKEFQINLENGVIRSISVDRSMTKKEIKQLKAIVSQFQVDTNAQNLLQSADNNLPERESGNAFYKTMEADVTGSCETLYDISILSDYLVAAHPKWVPLPKLKEQGDFIKIEKTRNFNNCNERNGFLAAYKSSRIDYNTESNSDSDERSTEQRTSPMNKGNLYPLVTRVVISGDLQSYVIQSSATFGNDGKSSDYLEVMLEYVQEVNRRPFVSLGRLINVGNLAQTFNEENRDWDSFSSNNYNYNYTQLTDLQNLQGVASARCPKADSKFTACFFRRFNAGY